MLLDDKLIYYVLRSVLCIKINFRLRSHLAFQWLLVDVITSGPDEVQYIIQLFHPVVEILKNRLLKRQIEWATDSKDYLFSVIVYLFHTCTTSIPKGSCSTIFFLLLSLTVMPLSHLSWHGWHTALSVRLYLLHNFYILKTLNTIKLVENLYRFNDWNLDFFFCFCVCVRLW